MARPINAEGEDSHKSEDERILAGAHAFIARVEEAESEQRKLELDDLKFAAGEQWDPRIIQERQADGRPCLVVNRIPQFIQQITNDQRQNRPSIKVHPVDDKADVETAKVRQGLIRHIEYNSNADTAYDTAFDSAANCGRGYLRVLTDYCDPMSFDQDILIKRIPNHFSVYFDPHSTEPDGSDAKKAAIVDDMSHDDYKAQYPGSKLTGEGDWTSIGTDKPSWMKDDSVRVAEYFFTEFKEVDLVLLSDGTVLQKDELATYAEKAIGEMQAGAREPAQLEIVQERRTKVPTITWCKINAVEVLEKTEWIGKYIPIVPVYGTTRVIDGKRTFEGIVRNAKDPQRMLNYWKSAETEAIALAPRTPFIMAEGQDEGYEDDWKSANRRNHAYLKYKPTTIGGVAAPPPQRNTFEPAVGVITNASMQAADDLKATTGIYDASLGARSNEQSGVAIQRRNMQAQTSNFHFIDNLTRSLRHTGRIVDDLLPKIYDAARIARIIGEDGEQKVVKLNQPTDEVGKDGKPRVYDLSAGKYDVTVDVGPSFASKRQEAAQSMIEMTKVIPSISQAAPDLIVRNMDWPGAQELADRIKKTLPPGLADDKDKGQQIPPQVQAQMQQMNQMVGQLTSKLNEAQHSIEMKQVEIQSRERIEMAKLETQATIELAKLESKEAMTALSHQIAEIDARTKMLGFGEPMNFGGERPEFESPASGAMGADAGEELEPPTGGESPGQPMEGNANDDPSNLGF